MTKANELLDALKDYSPPSQQVPALLAVIEEAGEALGRISLASNKVFSQANVFNAPERPIIRFSGDVMQEADAALATIKKAKEICHE